MPEKKGDSPRPQLNIRLSDSQKDLVSALRVKAKEAGMSTNAFLIRELYQVAGLVEPGNDRQNTPSLPTIDRQNISAFLDNLEENLAPMLDKMLGDRFAVIEERLGKLRA